MSDEFFDANFFVEGLVFGGEKGDIKVGARLYIYWYIYWR